MKSPATALCEQLAACADPHGALDAVLDALTPVERAQLWHAWETFWARPEQLPPEGAWSSWGQLTGKGWGKNRANAEAITIEVIEGRARCVGLCGQTEDRTVDMMVHDEDCGLIAVSPPWFKAKWKLGHVVWPNGATAYVYSPESAGAIHGHSHDLFWASEIHVWPSATMLRAWDAINLGVRKGAARLIWDSNTCPRHPIIRELLDRAIKRPHRHKVTRGATYANADNLSAAQLEEWIAKWGGTAFGRQWLEGEQCDEAEGATFKQIWIERARRAPPARFRRRIICIDPAISTEPGTDATGLIEMALDDTGQLFVLDDFSGKLEPEAWGMLALERYLAGSCDCVMVERNRGGSLCTQNLRAAALELSARLGRHVRVELLDLNAPTRHVPGVVYVKELYSRDDKTTRALPVAPLYEHGLVSHAIGAEERLAELESEMCTFVPGPKIKSPNRLDAMVFGAWELADLGRDGPSDARAAVRAAVAASARVRPATPGVLGQGYRFGQGRRL